MITFSPSAPMYFNHFNFFGGLMLHCSIYLCQNLDIQHIVGAANKLHTMNYFLWDRFEIPIGKILCLLYEEESRGQLTTRLTDSASLKYPTTTQLFYSLMNPRRSWSGNRPYIRYAFKIVLHSNDAKKKKKKIPLSFPKPEFLD